MVKSDDVWYLNDFPIFQLAGNRSLKNNRIKVEKKIDHWMPIVSKQKNFQPVSLLWLFYEDQNML